MKYLFIVLIIFLHFPQNVQAGENQFIIVVNPVRISIYSPDPAKSLTNQYTQVKINGLSASWLLTFDAISYPGVAKVVKTMDENQDIGIFLEVTEPPAKAAGVKYNKTDSWHRSKSVFVSGYEQSDRLKLIDNVFNKFKEELGFYPKSVGAWWIDSYSLDYMQKKYGITANLVVADQFETDGYTLWGQYWGAPYYPSKLHAAIPAQNEQNKIAVVNLQWAPRDPLNGYTGPTNLRASLYSTQDYYTVPLSDQYFEKLIELYAGKHNNDFGQITFGLEGDFPSQSYLSGGQYDKYIQIAKKFTEKDYISYNMAQFSKWYLEKYQLSSPYLVETKDLLDKEVQSIWYQNSKYRIGLVIDQAKKTVRIVDLRIYQENFQEPFFSSPNKQLDLYINIPSVIDTKTIPENFIEFNYISFKEIQKNGSSYKIVFDADKTITLNENQIIFSSLGKNLPKFVFESPYIKINKTTNNLILIPQDKFPYPETGFYFRDLTVEASFYLNQNKIKVLLSLLLIIFAFIIFKILQLPYQKKKLLFPIALLLFFSVPVIFFLKNSQYYSVTQSEVDGLFKLRSLTGKGVLVLDNACLQCHYNTPYKLASFAGKKGYIKKLANKELIFDSKLIEYKAPSSEHLTEIKREEALNYLNKFNADYIYLIKHDDYQEMLPFSPGDLGVERIFINSDTEIWKVK